MSSAPSETASPNVAGSIIFEPDATFRPGELASWRANLLAPIGSGALWILVEELPDGRVFEHWREPLVLDDTTVTTIEDERDLWVYAHNGAGTFRMRYVGSDGKTRAEGTFKLVP